LIELIDKDSITKNAVIAAYAGFCMLKNKKLLCAGIDINKKTYYLCTGILFGVSVYQMVKL